MNKTAIILMFLCLAFVSANVEGDSCQSDSDCQSFNYCIDLKCKHKELFPIEAPEVLSTIWIVLVNSVSTAAGLGFGASVVPYYQLFMHYSQSNAISVAYLSTFGGGLGNLMNTIKIRNKETGGPIINYNMALIVVPSLVFGSQLGVLVRRILPSFISSLILLGILLYGGKQFFFKARHQYHLEKKSHAKHPQDLKAIEPVSEDLDQAKKVTGSKSDPRVTSSDLKSDQQTTTMPVNDSPQLEVHMDVVVQAEIVEVAKSPEEADPAWQARREYLIKREAQLIPLYKLKEIVLVIVLVFVLCIIRGGKGVPSIADVEYCSDMEFGMLGIQLAAYLFCIVRSSWLIHGWEKEKELHKIPFHKDYFKLNPKIIARSAITSVLAGFIGAIAALGGGTIVVPMMFKMGISPAVASYTAGALTIFTTFNSAVQTYFTGTIDGQQIAWFVCMSMLFSWISAKVVGWIFRKTGRQAFLPFMIFVMFVIAFILLLALLIIDCVNSWDKVIAAKKFC